MFIKRDSATLALALLTVAIHCHADELTPAQRTLFEAKIRPVLVNSCYECHSKRSGKNEGGLTLDTKTGLRQGGNSGPGVLASNLDESWIWSYITHSDPDLRMA